MGLMKNIKKRNLELAKQKKEAGMELTDKEKEMLKKLYPSMK